ncbi:hypothetical protein RRG08_027691 [Elysia crispata]|uniref:Uncharacterized protein n=1 Tax=Elysia crispata TaxID=231223 RepID=A0AAE0XM77_9GAST|nr:hypothetical protein RRG08_027691 [Elysia crispata]
MNSGSSGIGDLLTPKPGGSPHAWPIKYNDGSCCQLGLEGARSCQVKYGPRRGAEDNWTSSLTRVGR